MYFDSAKSYKRLLFVFLLLSLFFVIVIVRIAQLSGIFHEVKPREGKKKVLRGAILDRRGMSLAITEEASSIGIAPAEVVKPEETAQFLSGYLPVDMNTILQKIYTNQNRNYFVLQRKIDNYLADLILDLRLPGVYRDYEYRRVYPSGRFLANVIGYVQNDTLQGMMGLEKIYNDLLSSGDTPFSGFSLQLTIDSYLQQKLEEVMQKYMDQSRAGKGIAILMDNDSGEILAMVNLPDFNPNEYYKEDVANRANWAITYPVEPGSIMKPFFAAMVLNEDIALARQQVVCSGEFSFETGTVRCLRDGRVVAHGKLDLEKVIEVSCNVGMIQYAKELDKNQIYRYLAELGFGRRTGIVPEKYEHPGYVPKPENWVPSHNYYLPIGQGMSATAMQILVAFSSILRDGVYQKPVLVKNVISERNGIVETARKETRTLPLRKTTTQTLKKYLLGVVERGTGKLAAVPFFKVLGKTGTAQKATPFGYTDRYTASFVGGFPYPSLKYSLIVIFDDVSSQYSGGNLAAPVFSQFIVAVRDYLFSTGEVKEVSPGKNLLQEDIWEAIEKEIQKHGKAVPDFKGRSLKEVLYWKKKILDPYNENRKHPVTLEITGSGYVFQQIPEPGTALEKTKKIQLYLTKDVFFP